jgi:hypothetical protein
MIEYQKRIKLRHGMKIMEFQMNLITNSVGRPLKFFWCTVAPIISFGKSTEMIEYQKRIKLRHGMKIMELQMNLITNSVGRPLKFFRCTVAWTTHERFIRFTN